MVNVRIASTDDAALLHSVAAATFALACPPGTTAESIADFIRTHLSEDRFAGYLADPSHELLLAEDDDSVAVGYTMLVFGDPTDSDVLAVVTARPTVELSKFYLLQTSHGSGVSAILMDATVERARLSGAASVWLGVNEHNARANRFYEKNGFVNVGTKHFLVGDKLEDDFVRERTLENVLSA